MQIQEIDPQPLWRHFTRICAVPRGSGNEAGLREMIVALAQRLGLAHQIDGAGNLLVRKPAAPGSGGRWPIVVQAHLDMVCEKLPAAVHDFGTDPIRPIIVDDRWVGAEGTTLGADNGIGVAAMMALMTDAQVGHGPLELLFTVEEETGMHGARNLRADWLTGTRMINLDAEHDATLIVGCAGSRCIALELPLETRPAAADHAVARITIEGLAGGHSGMDIHRGRANPIRLLARLLRAIGQQIEVHLVGIDGGLSPNALARQAEATVAFPVGGWHALNEAVAAVAPIFKDEYKSVDSGLSVEVRAIERASGLRLLSATALERCLDLLAVLPHGVLAMDSQDPVLVQTTTNLAFVRMIEGVLKIGTKQRSLIDSQLAEVGTIIAAAGRLAGCNIAVSGQYPAWRPRPASKFLSRCAETYENCFGRLPRIGAMHAGLECGLIAAVCPEMEIVAIGPNIFDPHSPGERVEIASVAKFWRYLNAILIMA